MAGGIGVAGIFAGDLRGMHAADCAHAGQAHHLVHPRLDRIHAAAQALVGNAVQHGAADRQAVLAAAAGDHVERIRAAAAQAR